MVMEPDQSPILDAEFSSLTQPAQSTVETSTSPPSASESPTSGESQEVSLEVPQLRPVSPRVNLPQVFRPTAENTLSIPTGSTVLEMTASQVAELICPGIPPKKALEFLIKCREGNINPFTEIHINKSANDRGSFDYNFIVGKWAYFRIAAEHPEYAGYTYREYPEADKAYAPPIWGECTVHRRGKPEVNFRLYYDEAISAVGGGGKTIKRTGYCTAQPRMYLRLVTIARAFREAFPDRLAGVYLQEEIK